MLILMLYLWVYKKSVLFRKVWRYQRDKSKKGRTKQWLKEKEQKDKQWSTNLHRKLKIEQHEPHKNRSGSEG